MMLVQNCSTRFADVEGVDEVQNELREAVAYLRNPEAFSRLGAQMPHGILLEGPPGTGKTLLARAVAGEAGVPFFAASASHFDEKYVGVGASRVRALFQAARKVAPAIIFIDEIDSVGSVRYDEQRTLHAQTLNALLVEMDGFAQNQGLVVIGATNQARVLDRALIRPGRFDRVLSVPVPDIGGRRKLLAHLAAKYKMGNDVDLEKLAAQTAGLTGHGRGGDGGGCTVLAEACTLVQALSLPIYSIWLHSRPHPRVLLQWGHAFSMLRVTKY